MKELFIKFLKKHGALRKFKVNLKIYRPKGANFDDFVGDFDEFVDNFGGAFVWAETPEGHNYWSNLDNLWEEYKVKNAEKTK